GLAGHRRGGGLHDHRRPRRKPENRHPRPRSLGVMMRSKWFALAVLGWMLAGCGEDVPGVLERQGPGCGDGVVAAGEACDDGNLIDGDGCSSTCEVEAGFACEGSPSVCVTTCGDGIVAGGEA